jgi:hypothetical protein
MITSKDQESPSLFTFELNDEYNLSALKPEIEPINAIKEELFTFYRSIAFNEPVVVTIDDGYRALDLAHQILEKLKSANHTIIDNN